MGATIYFGVVAVDITGEIYPDTDATSSNIESLAQRLEYDVMGQLSLTAAPTETIKKERLKFAIILFTASELESREPHSRADGSVREDKFSRVLWMQKAKDILSDYKGNNPVFFEQPFT
jgi:hypothetical protein